GSDRASEQPIEPLAANVWQVAGQNEISVRASRGECGSDPGERPLSLIVSTGTIELLVLDHRQSQNLVSFRWSNDGYGGSQWLNKAGDSQNKRLTAKIKQALWLAHARAYATGEDEGRNLVIPLHGIRSFSLCGVPHRLK